MESERKLLIISESCSASQVISDEIIKSYPCNIQLCIDSIENWDAQSLISYYQPTVILFDMASSEFDFFSLINQLQRNFWHIPLIAMVDYGNARLAQFALDHGVLDYLYRPFSKLRLKAVIRNAFQFYTLLHYSRHGASTDEKPFNEVWLESETPSDYQVDYPYPLPSTQPSFINSNSNSQELLSLLDTKGELRKLRDIEAAIISFAVNYNGGQLSQTSRKLGIGRSTLYRKMHEFDINTKAVANS